MNYIPLDWADLRLLTYIYFIKFRIAAYFGQNRTLFFGFNDGSDFSRSLGLAIVRLDPVSNKMGVLISFSLCHLISV